MSQTFETLTEPMTAYVTTGLDGKDITNFQEVDYSFAFQASETIKRDIREDDIISWTYPRVYAAPESHAVRWPLKLYELEIPAGAVKMSGDTSAGFIVSQIVVKDQLDAELALGPQWQDLAVMASALESVTSEQQEKMSNLNSRKSTVEALTEVRRAVKENGRDNVPALMQYMWKSEGLQDYEERGSIWARMPIGNAALVLAHRDLLTEEPLAEYAKILARPWNKVMGEPKV